MSFNIRNPGGLLLSILEVTKVLCVRVSIRTVRRWISKGVAGERLASTKIGGRIYVALADLQAFVSRLNAQPDRTSVTVRSTPKLIANNSKVSRGEAALETEQKLDAIFGPKRRRSNRPQKGGDVDPSR